MKKLLVLAFIITISNNFYSQIGCYDKPKDIKAIKNRTLLVEIKEYDEKKVKKLSSKPNDLVVYKQKVDDYNKNLKDAFEKEWNYSKTIEFLVKEDIKSKIKTNRDEYAYFRTFVDNGFNGELDKNIIEIISGRKAIFSFQYSTLDFSLTDAIFIVQYAQNYFNRCEVKRKNKEIIKNLEVSTKNIKNKLLYIDKNQITNDLIKGMNKQYGYKYELVTKDKIDEAILEKNQDVAYFKILTFAVNSNPLNDRDVIAQTFLIKTIVSAKDSKIMAIIPTGMNNKNAGKMTSKDLKKLVKALK